MELDMVRGSQQKFTFQGTSETYDQKINRPTKWKEQTTEIYKVFNLNFHPGFKNPLEYDSALMFRYKNHEINYFFPILIHIFRHSTNTKILKVSTSLEKKKRLFRKFF